jgi:hypothetical protein
MSHPLFIIYWAISIYSGTETKEIQTKRKNVACGVAREKNTGNPLI